MADIASAPGLGGKGADGSGDGDPNTHGDGNGDDGEDEWARHLNWATGDNPDGVPVVRDPMDQALCGSCWAVSALGTLEASIARNVAYVAYDDAYASLTLDDDGPSSAARAGVVGGDDDDDEGTGRGAEDPRELAAAAARLVEGRAVEAADLSVQELVDCDTRYDQVRGREGAFSNCP